jgi:hypothetical protein
VRRSLARTENGLFDWRWLLVASQPKPIWHQHPLSFAPLVHIFSAWFAIAAREFPGIRLIYSRPRAHTRCMLEI